MKHAAYDLNARFDWALRSIKGFHDNSIKEIFDIGAGKEALKNKLISEGLSYSAFDILPPNGDVRRWNIEEPFPYKGKADVVIMLEVIEHLNNPWLGMKNIVDIIRPGGFLVLTTPNPSWSESRLHTFSKGVPTMFTNQDLEVNHHVFTPWKHILSKVITDNRMQIKQFDYIGGNTNIMAHPFWGIKMPLRLAYRTVKIIIEKLDIDSTGPISAVIAQKEI